MSMLDCYKESLSINSVGTYCCIDSPLVINSAALNPSAL